MLEFIIFILSTIGATLILTQSYLFKRTRDKAQEMNESLGKLLKCCQCSGMYVGSIIKTLLIIYYSQLTMMSIIIIITYGFIGSFVCYLTYLLIKPLIEKYD